MKKAWLAKYEINQSVVQSGKSSQQQHDLNQGRSLARPQHGDDLGRRYHQHGQSRGRPSHRQPHRDAQGRPLHRRQDEYDRPRDRPLYSQHEYDLDQDRSLQRQQHEFMDKDRSFQGQQHEYDAGDDRSIHWQPYSTDQSTPLPHHQHGVDLSQGSRSSLRWQQPEDDLGRPSQWQHHGVNMDRPSQHLEVDVDRLSPRQQYDTTGRPLPRQEYEDDIVRPSQQHVVDLSKPVRRQHYINDLDTPLPRQQREDDKGRLSPRQQNGDHTSRPLPHHEDGADQRSMLHWNENDLSAATALASFSMRPVHHSASTISTTPPLHVYGQPYHAPRVAINSAVAIDLSCETQQPRHAEGNGPFDMSAIGSVSPIQTTSFPETVALPIRSISPYPTYTYQAHASRSGYSPQSSTSPSYKYSPTNGQQMARTQPKQFNMVFTFGQEGRGQAMDSLQPRDPQFKSYSPLIVGQLVQPQIFGQEPSVDHGPQPVLTVLEQRLPMDRMPQQGLSGTEQRLSSDCMSHTGPGQTSDCHPSQMTESPFKGKTTFRKTPEQSSTPSPMSQSSQMSSGSEVPQQSPRVIEPIPAATGTSANARANVRTPNQRKRSMPNGNDEEPKTCEVCNQPSSGNHYRARTCEGCKGFFRRTVQAIKDGTAELPACKKRNGLCDVVQQRNNCQYCRFKKCLDVGMCEDSVMDKEGRENLAGVKRKNRAEKLKRIETPATRTKNEIGNHFPVESTMDKFYQTLGNSVQSSYQKACDLVSQVGEERIVSAKQFADQCADDPYRFLRTDVLACVFFCLKLQDGYISRVITGHKNRFTDRSVHIRTICSLPALLFAHIAKTHQVFVEPDPEPPRKKARRSSKKPKKNEDAEAEAMVLEASPPAPKERGDETAEDFSLRFGNLRLPYNEFKKLPPTIKSVYEPFFCAEHRTMKEYTMLSDQTLSLLMALQFMQLATETDMEENDRAMAYNLQDRYEDLQLHGSILLHKILQCVRAECGMASVGLSWQLALREINDTVWTKRQGVCGAFPSLEELERYHASLRAEAGYCSQKSDEDLTRPAYTISKSRE